MKKAIFLVGAPGTGKTTAAVKIMCRFHPSKYNRTENSQVKLLPYVEFSGRHSTWRVLGRFDGLGYAQGTDRLSMGVQPHFEAFVRTQSANLLIEGDRLANAKSLEACLGWGYRVSVVELRADARTRQVRYTQRGSEQSESFIKGRLTKIRNLRLNMAGDHPNFRWTHLNNNDEEDAQSVHKHLEGLVVL